MNVLSSRVLKTEVGQMESGISPTFPLVPLAFEYLPLTYVYTFFLEETVWVQCCQYTGRQQIFRHFKIAVGHGRPDYNTPLPRTSSPPH